MVIEKSGIDARFQVISQNLSLEKKQYKFSHIFGFDEPGSVNMRNKNA